MNEENLNPVAQPSEAPNNDYYKSNKVGKGLAIAAAIAFPLAAVIVAVVTILPKLGHDAPVLGSSIDIGFPKNPSSYDNNGSFGLDFLRQAYATENGYKNIAVSPYSMDAVWQLALSGANGETKSEIVDAIGEHSMHEYPQLKSSNGIFVRDSFKEKMNANYLAKFDGDLRYDSFASPDSINDWVKNNTDGMIDGILDEAPSGMNILLLNAIAMDEKWADEFECDNTKAEMFESSNNLKTEVSMMYGSADRYFETEKAKGIIREYEPSDDGSAFEFVGILPNSDVGSYLKVLDTKELEAISATEIKNYSKEKDGSVNRVKVSMPRFSYAYTMPKAKEVMSNLGVKKAFSSSEADFSNMVNLEDDDENVYVGDVMQRAFIQMSETGTKAAAISAIPMATTGKDSTKYNNYRVDFNKAFIYLIRDKESKEIIFAGVVESPEKWTGTTCEEDD